MKIVVTGSLGHIGQPLTAALVQNGHTVTVISSNPSKQTAIEALGAQAAIGSLQDTVFVTQAFTGADAVFCITPPNYQQPDQTIYYEEQARIYASAIRATGVKRVVYLSSYGAHLPSGTGLIIGSYRSEQILNTLPNVSITHMRPTYFYYNLLHFVPMIKTAGFIGAVYGGDDPLTMVSPKDIAAAVADELQKSSSAPVRYVASDDRTCNEVASVIGKAIGMPELKWLVLPKENVLQSLLQQGMPANAAHNLVEVGEAIHTGKLREDYDAQNIPIDGKVKLEEYAHEFAQLFNSK